MFKTALYLIDEIIMILLIWNPVLNFIAYSTE